MSLAILCLLNGLAGAAETSAVLAFPGAEGFGAAATGGRGGEVYHVTTLDDDGAGSFRDAVSQPKRIVVFDVGGIIRLKKNVSVSSNITIAGQTAPGDGICLYGKSLSLSGSNNVIVRYMRLRQGIDGDRGNCSLRVATGHNMIFDHLSIEWGRWDSLGLTVNTSDITLQNCIIGESLDPQRFGALVDTVTNVTISHNLWLNNHSRNPKAKGTIQYINNVVYNWGITGLAGGHSAADHYLDVINNYLIKGPSSNNQSIGGFTETDKVYDSGNLVDLDRDGQANGRPVSEADYKDSKGAPVFEKAAWGKPQFAVTVDPAPVALEKVLAGAGCSLVRDSVDQRLIDEVKSFGKKGKIIDKEADVGGLGEIKTGAAPADTDRDGIPDAWETAHGMNPNDPTDAKKLDKAGHSLLEVYLNGLCDKSTS